MFTDGDIEDLNTMVRFPKHTSIKVKAGNLLENVIKEKSADINIFTIEEGMKINDMVNMVNQSRISAVFCADSEFENVLV